jgi:SPP1 family predicted phage head-tail adaptor
MRAGALRHRITIESHTDTNTRGEVSESWSTFKEVWASIEPLKGREWIESGILESEVDARVRMRYLKDVKPQMRITYGDYTYEIVSIRDIDMRKREMILMVKENVI